MYALVNTTSDPLTQLATTHSPEEIAFVKRLLDAMFETNNTARAEIMAVSDTQAARLHKPASGAARTSLGGGEAASQTQQTQQTSAGLTIAQAEKCLASLVAEGWLDKSRARYYSLSPRALMELRGWLMETYNEPGGGAEEGDDGDGVEPPVHRIRLCAACREIVTSGQRCATEECECRLHAVCAAQLLGEQRARGCPKCGAAWTGEHLVGEKADRQFRRSRGGN